MAELELEAEDNPERSLPDVFSKHDGESAGSADIEFSQAVGRIVGPDRDLGSPSRK